MSQLTASVSQRRFAFLKLAKTLKPPEANMPGRQSGHQNVYREGVLSGPHWAEAILANDQATCQPTSSRPADSPYMTSNQLAYPAKVRTSTFVPLQNLHVTAASTADHLHYESTQIYMLLSAVPFTDSCAV